MLPELSSPQRGAEQTWGAVSGAGRAVVMPGAELQSARASELVGAMPGLTPKVLLFLS